MWINLCAFPGAEAEVAAEGIQEVVRWRYNMPTRAKRSSAHEWQVVKREPGIDDVETEYLWHRASACTLEQWKIFSEILANHDG